MCSAMDGTNFSGLHPFQPVDKEDRSVSSAKYTNESMAQSRSPPTQPFGAQSCLPTTVDEIICNNSPAIDTDSLSTATAGSTEADSEASAYSKGVKRAGRRAKHWLSDEGKPPLSYELQLGVRILGSFMVESLKSNTAPFLNRVDEEVAPRYYDIVQHPVWLNLSKF